MNFIYDAPGIGFILLLGTAMLLPLFRIWQRKGLREWVFTLSGAVLAIAATVDVWLQAGEIRQYVNKSTAELVRLSAIITRPSLILVILAIATSMLGIYAMRARERK